MVADGIEGQESGNIQNVMLHCASWTATQTVSGTWVIRRGMRATTPVGGSGTGTPFGPYMIPDESVDMNPGVLRNLHDRWFAPDAMMVSRVIDLYVTGRAAELR